MAFPTSPAESLRFLPNSHGLSPGGPCPQEFTGPAAAPKRNGALWGSRRSNPSCQEVGGEAAEVGVLQYGTVQGAPLSVHSEPLLPGLQDGLRAPTTQRPVVPLPARRDTLDVWTPCIRCLRGQAR